MVVEIVAMDCTTVQIQKLLGALEQAISVHPIYSSICHKRLPHVSGFSRNFPPVGIATIYCLFKEWS